MNLRQYRSNIELIAERLKLSKDSRLSHRQIDFWVHQYRARGIREQFRRDQQISTAWVQDMGVMTVTQVNSGDDPLVTTTSKNLGKITLPQLVDLPEDHAVYRIAKPSNLSVYHLVDFNYMMQLVPGSATSKFDYCARVSQAMYLSPCAAQVRPMLILENPMDGYVIQTEKVAQDALTIGESYTVYGTQVTHNSTAYNPGNTFTAVATTYTGNGYVKFTDLKRTMRDTDPYPMSLTLSNFVTMMIFTQEFQVEKQQVADIINDAQDQNLIPQNADAVRRAGAPKESPSIGQ